MEKLFIEHTKDTPEVIFDPKENTFFISGVCHPENVTKFYEPVIDWLDRYKKETKKASTPKSITFELFFRYINSASYKFLISLLQKIYDLSQSGITINAIWYYEPEDIDMREAGTELFDYSGIKIPYECKVKYPN